MFFCQEECRKNRADILAHELYHDIIAEAMARQTMSEKQLADEKKKATAKKESDRIMTAAKETAVSLDTAEWKGENASYFYEAGGERAYLAIEKNADGTYQAYIFDSKDFQPINSLTAEQVTKLVDGTKSKLADATNGKNANEKNKRSKDEVTPTEDAENAESAEKTGENGTKLSLGEEQTSPRKKITRNMSEQERYEILKNRTITLSAKADMQKLSTLEAEHKSKIDNLFSLALKEKKALFKKIGEEFSIFKKYANADVELEFELSRGGLDESTQKQMKNYLDYVKMLTCIDQVIENAVGIEVHNRNNEGYKVDPTLEDSYVLISAFESDDLIIPVKLEIKKFTDKENKLYVAITLDGIKKEEIVTQGDTVNGVTQDAPSSVISIAQLFKKINPLEENFLKYVPKQFLANEGNNENSSKASLGPDPIVLEEGGEAKGESEYVEKEFKATPEEVKRASKMVKGFKFLPAKVREAIIEMLRTSGNIDKLTVSSIAHFMASREGLNVRFMKNHVAEGSFDVLKKSGERLILLDPKHNNGKHYRADILAHELYHDIIAESNADAGKALNEMIHESVSPSLRREIADRYTKHFNGKSISEYLAEKNAKWTEKNVKEYFKEYTKISYAEVMEEVSAGVMGKIVGQRRFIRQLRAKGLLARTFDHIRNICGAIANRAMTAGGDSSPGFTIAFRDALQFKTLYSQALIATNTTLTPALVSELKGALQSVAEMDEEKARTKLSLPSKTQEGRLDPRTVTKDDVIELLTKVKNGEITGNHYIPIRINTPSILIEWAKRRNDDAIDNNPIAMSADKAYQAMAQKRIGPENRPHKLTIGDMIAIIEGMSDPQYIVYQSNGRYVEVVEYETSEKKKALAILEIGNYKPEWTMNGYEDGLYNMLVTTFPPDSGVIADVLNNKQNKIIYDKKKDASRGTPSSMVPSVSNETSFFEESIPQSTPKVNTKLSLPSDADYLDAVSRGDMVTAQRMVDEAARKAGYTNDSSYQGSLAFNGAAPSANAYFETKEERKEAFDNDEFEGDYSLGDFVDTGLDNNDLEWQLNNHIAASGRDPATLASLRNLTNTVKQKKRTIKMYRAVDSKIEEGSFRNGDWITPSRQYAEKHIELQDWESGRIIEQEVSIDHIWWNGDDINEWGYDNGNSNEVYKNTKNNIKLAAITYDDGGNVIPLSERFNERNPDTRYSLPMYPTLPDSAEVEVELNERDWGFDWSDENIRKNLSKIHEYLDKHYPDFDINIQVNRERDHIIVNHVAYALDVDNLLTQDAQIGEFLISIGIKPEQIGQHALQRAYACQKAHGRKTRRERDEVESECSSC